MLHPTLSSHLQATLDTLLAAYRGSAKRSTNSMGHERETFVADFLRRVFPQTVRFGRGDIIDSYGKQSGQIDLVVEHPILYSFAANDAGSRLFTAESVAAVIEVKSDLRRQWKEVEATVGKVAELRRRYPHEHTEDVMRLMEVVKSRMGETKDIDELLGKKYKELQIEAAQVRAMAGPAGLPCFVVGYKGWKKPKNAWDRLDKTVVGILSLDPPYFVHRNNDIGTNTFSGPEAVLGFLDCLFLYLSLSHTFRPRLVDYGLSPLFRSLAASPGFGRGGS